MGDDMEKRVAWVENERTKDHNLLIEFITAIKDTDLGEQIKPILDRAIKDGGQTKRKPFEFKFPHLPPGYIDHNSVDDIKRLIADGKYPFVDPDADDNNVDNAQPPAQQPAPAQVP